MYHENGASWSGSTGFYYRDHRSTPAAGQSKTWTMYVWAPMNYADDQMELAIVGRFGDEATFTLRLDAVPAGVTGAPAVGSTWDIPARGTFELELPTHKTEDGKTGYQFTVTATMAADDGPNGVCLPAAAPLLLTLAAGGWVLSRPRSRR